MATNTKIVPLPGPGQSLRPELREFLDAVVVPALLIKYLAENGSETNAEICIEAVRGDVSYFDATGSPKPARTGK
jgi:hypothetical protein